MPGLPVTWSNQNRVSVYTGGKPNDWTNMTRPGDWEVRKRAYLAGRSNHRLLEQRGGWTGEGVLMNLKMFLNKTLTQQLPKSSRALHVCHEVPDKVQIRAEAGYWESKRRKITSIFCKAAEIQQFSLCDGWYGDTTMINGWLKIIGSMCGQWWIVHITSSFPSALSNCASERDLSS